MQLAKIRIKNYIQPFKALAPKMIAISEIVPFTEKNKIPIQPYFLRITFHFGNFSSSIDLVLYQI